MLPWRMTGWSTIDGCFQHFDNKINSNTSYIYVCVFVYACMYTYDTSKEILAFLFIDDITFYLITRLFISVICFYVRGRLFVACLFCCLCIYNYCLYILFFMLTFVS